MIALVGPTASGKSDLALRLAERYDGAILSVDSMQVYRGMDIGTAKPTRADQARVPHFMIDVADPRDDFSVADFQRLGRQVLAGQSHRLVVVTGGSGLHLRALVDPMDFPPHDAQVRAEVEALGPAGARSALLESDPRAGEVMDLANPRRVSRALEIVRLTGQTPSVRASTAEYRALRAYRPLIPFTAWGFDPGDALEGRVRSRVAAMLSAGLVEEVAGLRSSLGTTAAQAVGYKEILPYLHGDRTLAEATEDLVRSTLGLAKRQRTFFRRDPRIQWLAWDGDPARRLARLTAALDKLT